MAEGTNDTRNIKTAISPRELIYRYVRYLPWVILSMAVALIGAYVKLRYSTPIYSVSGKLLVTSQTPYGGGSDKFDDIFSLQRVDKINDEIEIIRSRNVAARVVRSLGLQKQVYNRGKIRSTIIHPEDAPFNFEIISVKDSSAGFSVLVTFLNEENQYRINEQPQKQFFNEVVALPSVTFRITSNGRSLQFFASKEFIISWNPLEQMASGLSGSINVARVNEVTNVLVLTYQTENTKLGKDIVDTYMSEYQKGSLEDKKQIAAQTLQFIDEQLDTVFHELGGVESNLQKYRERHRVFSPELQTQQFFEEVSENNRALGELEVKVKVADYLLAYISDEKNRFRIIPSMLGIDEPSLLQQVMEFNRLQLERETALNNVAVNNPIIINMESAIGKLRTDMIQSLQNVRATYVLSRDQLTGKTRDTDKLINSIPFKEKQIKEVTRQQNILQELYSYLLQKKLETAIASASTISNIKVVEPALASGSPVSPNKKGLYLLAIFAGIVVPVGIIFMIESLNDKVRSKTDIKQATETPILGEIGHSDDGNALVVTQNNRKFIAEQFRVVRSNLQYILPKVEKPVLLVTSSFSGEGKSFISTNLGSVLALSGKRTVILEFDIRKPKILKGLGLNERKGITNFLVGSVRLEDVIYPVPDVTNLFVIPCGPVPPNPSEILLNERVGELFIELRKRFDAIIIDTAPVGLVSDAITLSQHASASVYIVRHGYTLKKQIGLIDEIYKHNKLPHLCIIINDIKATTGYGGYYGYGGYGYGYGYGYGMSNGETGYFDNGTRKKKGWRKWFAGNSKK